MSPKAIVVGLDNADVWKNITKLRTDRTAVFGGLVAGQHYVAVSQPEHLRGVDVDPSLITFTDNWDVNPHAAEIVEALRARVRPVVAGFVHKDYKPTVVTARHHW